MEKIVLIKVKTAEQIQILLDAAKTCGLEIKQK